MAAGLDALNPVSTSVNTMKKAIDSLPNPQAAIAKLRPLKRFAVLNGCLVGITALSGAYVAGNDAGRAYNTFPKMNDEWFPKSEYFKINPTWRNFFENTANVQFNHRYLALTTFSSIWVMYLSNIMAGSKGIWKTAALPKMARVSLTALTHMSLVQVGLGISTLLTYVPVCLAATHQVRTFDNVPVHVDYIALLWL